MPIAHPLRVSFNVFLRIESPRISIQCVSARLVVACPSSTASSLASNALFG